jgi:protein-S-isoprenylcysteine O-methyltransferase Ste14
MNPVFWVFLGLCLLGLGVRSGYETLKQGNKIDSKNNFVFIIVFVAMSLMLTSWVGMGLFDPWRIGLHGFFRWLGLVTSIIGLGIAVGALLQLGGLENIDHLVTTGFFLRLRHPMYAGFILWIIGWLLFFSAGATSMVAVVAIGNILYWRSLEEKKLLIQFGQRYIDYQKHSWF